MSSAEDLHFEPKKILCAVDLTPASKLVLKWARFFADAYGAKLDVVHADYFDYPPYMLPSESGRFVAEGEARRSDLHRQLAALVGDAIGMLPSVELTILDGHPVEALLRRVDSSAPDMIAIGSHGHSGFSRLYLGSVAESLVRTTVAPTLVARTRENQPVPKVGTVLCPINFDATGHRSLQVAAQVARMFRAQLSVLHAVDEAHFDLDASYREICQWVSPKVREQCAIVEVVRHGNPAEQILLAAREQSTDLIVLGAERRPFFDLRILGVTAERVLRHAESSVLVLPSEREFAT
ncbi:MAG TPA: universal stress protein [Candidatus Dormibacteraeota bacterium]|nr:universal stress protein [Candidatus Dormibacteraeota bacterium]